MKVVLDTNVVISRAVSPNGAPAIVISRWLDGAFELLISTGILAEYRRALSYPRVQQHIRIEAEAVESMLADFANVATVVEPEHLRDGVSADPEDDKFLECALAGRADYIVSGDQHLLQIATFRDIAIVSPSTFLVLLGDENSA